MCVHILFSRHASRADPQHWLKGPGEDDHDDDDDPGDDIATHENAIVPYIAHSQSVSFFDTSPPLSFHHFFQTSERFLKNLDYFS